MPLDFNRKPGRAEPPDRWTERDVPGERYMELCAADKRGEVRLSQWAVGSSPGRWHVLYFQRSQFPPAGTNAEAAAAAKGPCVRDAMVRRDCGNQIDGLVANTATAANKQKQNERS